MRKFIQRFIPFFLISCFVILILWLIPLGYSQEWTGFGASTIPTNPNEQPAKKLWDWLGLLVIPAILALSALLFSRAERRNEQAIANQRNKEERKIADDRAEEAALQSYLEQMSIFLIDKELRKSEEGSEVRDLARAWTLTFLRRLNHERKGVLLRFLYESELITKDNPIVSLNDAILWEVRLRNARLRNVDLRGADMSQAYLFEAILCNADLRGTNLIQSYLTFADLSNADLREADLTGANLSNANLSGTNLSNTVLREVFEDPNSRNLKMLKLIAMEATLSNAKYTIDTKWPDGFDPISHGAILVDK